MSHRQPRPQASALASCAYACPTSARGSTPLLWRCSARTTWPPPRVLNCLEIPADRACACTPLLISLRIEKEIGYLRFYLDPFFLRVPALFQKRRALNDLTLLRRRVESTSEGSSE